ncbi:MAG: caspase family protein [bacterium]|nr:MAG: caspase family protein [bacterium]
MKRALLVGIDDYPGIRSDLKGSIKDIEGWASLLMERFEFTRENIRLLVNERAKKEEVIKRLKWLKYGVGNGDTLVFIFSGHGATFTERHELGHIDEAKDEALVLHGYGVDDMLIDDELSQIFSNISLNVNLTIICDSCYSGGLNNFMQKQKPDREDFSLEQMEDLLSSALAAGDITLARKILENREQYAALQARCRQATKADESKKLPEPKYFQLPDDLEHRNDPNSLTRGFGYCLSKKEGLELSENHDNSRSKSLLLAACQETGIATASYPGTEGLSVFSYFAIQALRFSQNELTARELIKQVTEKIGEASLSQKPQLKGRRDLYDKLLFK